MHTTPPPRLTLLGEALCGSFAGGLTRALIAPLDVLKVRFQLQGPDRPYTRLLAAAARISREEGPRALWRGSAVGVALWVAYMGVQFPTYRAARRALRAASLPDAPAAALSGASAGALATLATYPLDWARTQLASGAAGANGGAWSVLRPALASPGGLLRARRSWYAGLRPALAAVLPSVALMFAFHEQLCLAWDGSGVAGQLADAGATPELCAQARSAACGGAAGAAAKLATHPLDTAKKLLQAQDAPRIKQLGAPHPRFEGAVHALQSLPVKGWFRGLTPSLWKAGVASALAFWAYEGAARGLLAFGEPFAEEARE